MTSADGVAIWVTLQLALVTTGLLLMVGMPLAWWLATTRSRWRFLVEALVALPLVLPPTVLGFYLLLSMGPQGFLGQAMTTLGLPGLAFTFSGLVLGSVLYSLPFVVQPLQGAFAAIPQQTLQIATTLGASRLDRFFTVVMPLSRRGLIAATVLGFAHTVGEFGVVLMIGGNIEGETRVLSIAIYDHVETINYAQAHWLAGGLLVFSFAVLALVYRQQRRFLIANMS